MYKKTQWLVQNINVWTKNFTIFFQTFFYFKFFMRYSGHLVTVLLISLCIFFFIKNWTASTVEHHSVTQQHRLLTISDPEMYPVWQHQVRRSVTTFRHCLRLDPDTHSVHQWNRCHRFLTDSQTHVKLLVQIMTKQKAVETLLYIFPDVFYLKFFVICVTVMWMFLGLTAQKKDIGN